MKPFNSTHLEHTVIAVAVQLAIWPLFGLLAAGVIACAVFLGREIAQHEYKVKRTPEYLGLGSIEIPWWVGLRYGWSMDSILDIACPAGACAVIAVIGAYL